MAEFTFTNTSGELTLSADAVTYGYIGRAQFLAIDAPQGSASYRARSYAIYSIEWAGEILPAIALHPGRPVYISSMFREGNTWILYVSCGNGTYDNLGFDNLEPVEIFVFAAPQPGVLTGFNLFSADGSTITADLMRRPMTFNALAIFNGNQSSAQIPGNIGPMAVIGGPDDYRKTSSYDGSLYVNRTYDKSWLWNGASTLSKTDSLRLWTREDTGFGSVDIMRSSIAIIISTSGL